MLTLIATWNRFNCGVCGGENERVVCCERCGTTVCITNDHGEGNEVSSTDCYECRNTVVDASSPLTIWVNDREGETEATTTLEENDVYDEDEGIDMSFDE